MKSTPKGNTWPPELQRFIYYRPEQLGPTAPNLRQLEQLLYKIWVKKTGKTESDQQVLMQFQSQCGLDQAVIVEQEQHILQLLKKNRSVIIGLSATVNYETPSASTLCVWVANDTTQMFREVQVRVFSPDLSLPEGVQPRPIKLLDGQSICPVCVPYQAPQEALSTSVSLQVDVCDHSGTWHAYKNLGKLFLALPGAAHEQQIKIQGTVLSPDEPAFQLLLETFKQSLSQGDIQQVSQVTLEGSMPTLNQVYTVSLERDEEHTRHLRAVAATGISRSNRGTPASRGVLRNQDTQWVPKHIELVSRPFMIFGRHNKHTQTSLGDFALGFVADKRRISRFHFAVDAQPEGLAIIHTGLHERGYTALNGRELPRGHWRHLASGDRLDIAGQFTLEISLEWDMTQTSSTIQGTPKDGDRCGEYLLEIVALVRQLDKTNNDDLKRRLKKAFNALNCIQEKNAKRNGAETRGPLLYARFQREGDGRVTHLYLPKRVSLGSAPQRGLRVQAEGIQPYHADLLYKDGMYWIQNRTDSGDLWVCHHKLAANEMVGLETGDTIGLGTAQFVFEGF